MDRQGLISIGIGIWSDIKGTGGGGSVGPPSITLTDSLADNLGSTKETDYIVAIGTADPSRYLMFSLSSNFSGGQFGWIYSVLVGGVAATELIQTVPIGVGLRNQNTGFWGIAQPTGITATVSIFATATGGLTNHTIEFGVYSIKNVDNPGIVFDRATSSVDTNTNFNSTPLSLTIPANGVLFGVAGGATFGNASVSITTWTGSVGVDWSFVNASASGGGGTLYADSIGVHQFSTITVSVSATVQWGNNSGEAGTISIITVGGPDVPSWVMTADNLPATIDLDPANDRIWLRNRIATFASVLACSRAQDAYYTSTDGSLYNFAANTLRYGANGIMQERTAINVVLWSNNISDSSWVVSHASATVNIVTAPDGTLTAARFTEDNASAQFGHRFYQLAVPSVSQNPYMPSIYLRNNGRRYVTLRLEENGGLNNYGVGIDLSNGTTYNGVYDNDVQIPTPLTNIEVEALANGWYRIAGAFIASTTTNNLLFYLNQSPTVSNYVGDDVSGVDVWTAQFEISRGVPTSPIITTANSATRAIDLITFTDVSWLNDLEGTYYAETTIDVTSINGLRIWAHLNAESPMDAGTTTTINLFDGVNAVNATLGSGTWRTGVKGAMSHSFTGVSLVANNGTLASTSNPYIATHQARLGSATGGSNSLGKGLIKRAAAWDTRRTDNAIQTLSIP